jgi:hypothetical protein
MKRPDCFACINKANKKVLSAQFGLIGSAVRLKAIRLNSSNPSPLACGGERHGPAGSVGKS